jgi:hypothetical protein
MNEQSMYRSCLGPQASRIWCGRRGDGSGGTALPMIAAHPLLALVPTTCAIAERNQVVIAGGQVFRVTGVVEEHPPTTRIRADLNALDSRIASPLRQFVPRDGHGLLKLLSAVSMVFRSSSDILGAAFFIIWRNQSISCGSPG